MRLINWMLSYIPGTSAYDVRKLKEFARLLHQIRMDEAQAKPEPTLPAGVRR